MLQRAVICNRTLPNTKQIIQNHCHFLKVNKAQQKIFSIKPLLAFGKNKCLKQLIGGNVIQNYKSIKKKKNQQIRGMYTLYTWNTVTTLFIGAEQTFVL